MAQPLQTIEAIPAIDLAEVLEAVGEAAYVWDVASDRIEWSGSAHQVLGLAGSVAIDTATRFSSLLDPEALTSRREAVFGSAAQDAGDGVAFEVEYPLVRGPRAEKLWVEDRGRWTAGPTGRPRRVVGVMRRLGARYQSAEQAATLARFDPLTGQLSRARLIEIAGASLASATRMQSSSSFLLACLTNLGPINESYGFDVGDLAIVEVSRRLRSAMRGGDTLGRFSTSTFGMVLQECDRSDLDVASRRLAAAVHDAPVMTPAGPISVRVAVGAVLAPRHARDVDELVTRARAALARASESATPLVIYSPDPEREAAKRAKMRQVDELVGALNDQRVRLAFQPIVAASDYRPRWNEALVHVETADGTMTPGAPLANAAEEVGLVQMLDHRVLDLALGHLLDNPDARVSINVSASTTADESWIDSLSAWTVREPALAGRLMVEITETAAVGNLADAVRFVRELKTLGVTVAIDDFGAGPSSFKVLRDLAVDVVKIDGSFVRDLGEAPESGAFIRALIALARELGLATVADQVESAQAAALLTEWGVTYLQGDLIAPAEMD